MTLVHSTAEDGGSVPGAAASTPELYQPANGCEGADFMEAFCNRCTRDAGFRDGTGDSCPIAADSMVYTVEDEGYPKEWVYGPDDEPLCTAFERVADSASGSHGGDEGEAGVDQKYSSPSMKEGTQP